MLERVGRKKYNVFAYDVESHNDNESIALNKTSIWLSSFINENSKIDDEESYFYSIESWLDKLEILTSGKRKHGENRPIKNVCVYIFNASFEWSFILPVLLKKGFTFKDKIQQDDEYVFTSITTKSVSRVYSASFKFGKKSGVVLIKDLMLIFNGSLRNIAKSFNLPTQKGDIDYRLNRLHGHIPTKEEKEYCFKDTRIIIDILLEMDRRGDKAFFNALTTASYSCRKMLKKGFPHAHRPLKTFRDNKYFPFLEEEESEFLRKGCEGGLTYACESFQFKDIKKEILHIDAHQMHPSQMYFHLFPRGKGEYFKGRPPLNSKYISACRIKISYTHAKLHSIIKLIGLDAVDNYELVVWNFEIPTMKKIYEDLTIEFIDGYAYKSNYLPFREYFKENYDKRHEAKLKKDDFNIMYYKLLNNSSYGKFLEHGHNEVFENIIDENGHIDSVIIPKKEVNINSTYTYIPVGSCIPAYSRVCLIETALKFGVENIIYFDTDSIFMLKNENTLKVLETLNLKDELGGWGRENDILRGQFTAPKRYKIVEEQKGKAVDVVHMAGVNFEEPPNYEDLDLCNGKYIVQGKQKAEGGTLIIFKEKQIQVQEKYLDIYNKNSIIN